MRLVSGSARARVCDHRTGNGPHYGVVWRKRGLSALCVLKPRTRPSCKIQERCGLGHVDAATNQFAAKRGSHSDVGSAEVGTPRLTNPTGLSPTGLWSEFWCLG